MKIKEFKVPRILSLDREGGREGMFSAGNFQRNDTVIESRTCGKVERKHGRRNRETRAGRGGRRGGGEGRRVLERARDERG